VEPLVVAVVVVLLLSIYVGAGLAKKSRAEHPPKVGVVQLPSAPLSNSQETVSAEEAIAPPKRKPRRVVEITVDTPHGPVRFKKPRRPVAAVVVALGQSEDHLSWFFDVYRREYLERASAKVRKKEDPSWSDDYVEFAREAPMLLANLSNERRESLRENREKIERGEPTVLGTYATTREAREAARYLAKKMEPTRNAGWLQVHVVELPGQNV
jgi:hypothetical protein